MSAFLNIWGDIEGSFYRKRYQDYFIEEVNKSSIEDYHGYIKRWFAALLRSWGGDNDVVDVSTVNPLREVPTATGWEALFDPTSSPPHSLCPLE